MTRIAITKGRSALAVAADRAADHHERIILRRGRKDVAAVVPIEDLKLLERLREEAEDREDIEEAERILADPENDWVPLEKVKSELGLK